MKNNFLNFQRRDIITTETGWINQSKEDWERENKCLIIDYKTFGWFIGFGYWKEIYKAPFCGYTHNILLPFIRIQKGLLKFQESQPQQ